MADGSICYGRVGFVRIQGPDGSMHQYGCGGVNSDTLDFKFSISMPVGAIHTNAVIEVLGLSRETINFLTYFGYRNNERASNRKIEVWAGYEDTGPSLIFSGYVFSAMPTQPPERWLKIEADNYPLYGHETKEKAFSHASIKSILEWCAKTFSVNLYWNPNVKEDVIVPSFVASGRLEDILSSLSPFSTNFVIYFHEDIFVFNSKKGTNNSTETISTQTGMLNIQHVGLDGIVVRNRLSSRFQRGSVVTVKSEMIPAANGKYIVYELDHKGHFRGDDWDTIVHGYMTQEMFAKANQAQSS